MGQRAQCWTKRKGLAREMSGKIKTREEQKGTGWEEESQGRGKKVS